MTASTFSFHCKDYGVWSKSFGTKKESEKAAAEHPAYCWGALAWVRS